MTKEESARTNKKILSTKISKEQHDHLDKLSKQMGFRSPYDLMQTIAAVLVKYDANEYDATDANYQQICAFIEPFLEIEDFNAYTKAYLNEAAFGNGRMSEAGEIEFIVVRNGKLVSKFYRDDQGNRKIVHGVDSILMDLIKALRPWFHQLLFKAMKAMHTTSFIEWVRQSLIDQAPDIQELHDSEQRSMSLIQYGNVPKQKRNKRVEGFDGINYVVKKTRAQRSDNDYYTEIDDQSSEYDE